MYFKQFLHDERGCASYFIASRESREATVVDPQLNIEPYVDLANERGYQITLVIDTHLHADHVSGNRKLADATGARLCLHETADVDFPSAARWRRAGARADPAARDPHPGSSARVHISARAEPAPESGALNGPERRHAVRR